MTVFDAALDVAMPAATRPMELLLASAYWLLSALATTTLVSPVMFRTEPLAM